MDRRAPVGLHSRDLVARDGSDAMLFSSMTFLEFFAAVWGVHWLLRAPRHRHYWLLLASLVFYGSWNAKLLGLLAAAGAVNYFLVLWLDGTTRESHRRALLTTT